MIRHHLKTAHRALSRSKGISILNLIGFSIGLASCFLIVSFIRNELRFDTSHPDSDALYRVVQEQRMGAATRTFATTLGRATANIADRIAQVEMLTRIHRKQAVLTVGEEAIVEPDFAWADANIFDNLDFGLDVGNPESALQQPATIVLSRQLADRLFSGQNAIGNVVVLNNDTELTVTGILRQPDAPTHIPLEAVASYKTIADVENPWDGRLQGWAYVRLAPGSDPVQVERLIEEQVAEINPWIDVEANGLSYHLIPITDVRLRTSYIAASGNVADIRRLYLFTIIAILVLALACINFANLSTVSSIRRAREIGLRKTIGAERKHLVFQFLFESVSMAFMSLIIAMGMVGIGKSWFASTMNIDLSISPLTAPDLYGWFLAITLFAGLLAGSYPSFYLSRFNSIQVLKGGGGDRQGSGLRKSMLVLQMVVSSLLVFSSLVIMGQMKRLASENMGYEVDQLVSFPTTGYAGNIEQFKQRLRDISGVISVSHTAGTPASGGLDTNEEWDGQKISLRWVVADPDYVQTMGIEMAKGRFFDSSHPSEYSRAIVVNETYARLREWTDPLSEMVSAGPSEDGETRFTPVIGVVKDFQLGSLHQPTGPVIIDVSPQMAMFRNTFIIRLAAGDHEVVIDKLSHLWSELVPGRPFNLTFMDEQIASLYPSERRLSKLVNAFSILALIIANMGILGVASLIIALRRKETGVRKVLGASARGIVWMLSKEYVLLIALAGLITIPAEFIGADIWLSNYAIHINPGAGLAGLTLILVGLPSLIIVAYQAFRAASIDPVNTLRSE